MGVLRENSWHASEARGCGEVQRTLPEREDRQRSCRAREKCNQERGRERETESALRRRSRRRLPLRLLAAVERRKDQRECVGGGRL